MLFSRYSSNYFALWWRSLDKPLLLAICILLLGSIVFSYLSTLGFASNKDYLIKFIKGNVSQTLDNKSNIPDQISLLRIDTDLYNSTKKSLNILYPKVVINGLIIIDDYGHWKGCREAVDEYLKDKNYHISIVDASCRIIIKLT